MLKHLVGAVVGIFALVVIWLMSSGALSRGGPRAPVADGIPGASFGATDAVARLAANFGDVSPRVFHPLVADVFPPRGEDPIVLPLAGGGSLTIEEEGAFGERSQVNGTVSFAREGGRVYWSAGPEGRGFEEWLELSAGLAYADRPLARWRVPGSFTRSEGRDVIVSDASGKALARVSAPAAFAAGGRPVQAHLRASGDIIALHVDADGAAVLVDPWWETYGVVTPRAAGHQFLLPSGKVIVFGSGTSDIYDPDDDTWTPGPTMRVARSSSVAVQLLDGRILVIGGDGPSTCELYDPTLNTFEFVDSLNTARARHAAALLADGTVLVSGGYAGVNALTSAERYNPTTNEWTAVAASAPARQNHTATRLDDGRVLVVGGQDSNGVTLAGASVYDPTTNQWAPAGAMATARYEHTATLLPSGKVLVVGGRDASELASAEIFDPTNAITPWSAALGAPAYSRRVHVTTTLQNGEVLIAGGIGAPVGGDTPWFLRETEIYAEATGFRLAAPMLESRTLPSIGLIENGEVLVVSGADADVSTAAERYDPASDEWHAAGTMQNQRTLFTASQLNDGRVVILGGARNSVTRVWTVEAYDPALNRFVPLGEMPEPRHSHTATVLADGRRILVAGGFLPILSQRTATAFLFDADASGNPFTPVGSMGTARIDHTATLLNDGRVLVAGGSNGSSLNSAEIFDPTTGLWTPVPDTLSAARTRHTATLLTNGHVLIAGGVGLATADVFNPSPIVMNDYFSSTSNSMSANRSAHAAAFTLFDKVLLTGGEGGLTSSDIYDPIARTFETSPSFVPGPMTTGRGRHTATALGGGAVVVIGGRNANAVATAEVYDPITRTWFAGGSLTQARAFHSATRLADGRILLVGGAVNTNAQHYASFELWSPGCAELNGGCDIVTSCTDASRVVVCGPCPAGSSSASGTGSDDCVACGANFYQPAPGSQQCLPKYTCEPGSRVFSAGNTTTDRTCFPCLPGTYTSEPNQPTCSPHVVPPCGAGEYEAAAPSSTTDRVCSLVSNCQPGTREVAGPTPTSDRQCAVCDESYSTTINSASCTPWSSCAPGTFVSVPGSILSDRTCAPCASGFTTMANEEFCTDWTTCLAEEFESSAGTSTTDRSCTALTTCSAGSYVMSAATSTSDRQCAPCTSGYTASSNAPSCTPHSVCGADTFESIPATSSSDRACSALTLCAAGQYEVTAPTATSDRVCAACSSGSFSSSPGETACTPWTACAAGSFETAAPTATSDRVCQACTVCGAGTVTDRACTTNTDTTCKQEEAPAEMTDMPGATATQQMTKRGCQSAPGAPLVGVAFIWLMLRRRRRPRL